MLTSEVQRETTKDEFKNMTDFPLVQDVEFMDFTAKGWYLYIMKFC